MTKKINIYNLALSIIILLAAFLRFYRIEENLIFHGELGFDYLAVKNILEGKQSILSGPPTSHPWLSISPLFYWLFALYLPLFNWHPLGGSYFFAFLGILVIYVAYRTVSEFIDKNVALLTSFLLAVSPSWIELTRHSRFNSFIPFLFFFYLYFLLKSSKDEKYFFWLGLTMGVSFSFFPAILIWLPAAFSVFLLRRKRIRKKSLVQGLLGLVIPNIPFIVYNALNRFEIIIKLASWVPYRILGFFGFYPKNTANWSTIEANLVSLYVFFRESWFAEGVLVATILFWLIIVFFVTKSADEIVKRKHKFWMTTFVVFFVTYLALFIHGAPPKHYYYIIFPIPIIVLSSFLVWISRKIGLLLASLLVFIILFANFRYFFSEKWFFIPQDKAKKDSLPVPYKLQESIVSFIISDAQGNKFSLKRIGPLDHFERDFAQNYIYLLWREGNEPVDDAAITYTIYENTDDLPSNEKIYWISNIAITKKENAKN